MGILHCAALDSGETLAQGHGDLTCFIAIDLEIRRISHYVTPLTATAALLAERDNPGVKDWLFATTLSPAPAHKLALEKLGLHPLLKLGMEPQPALGALAALPMLLTGVEIAADA